MITPKKLPSGKISFKLTFEDADAIVSLIMSYLETESHMILSVKIAKDPARWMMYYVIDEFYRKHSGKLLSGSGAAHGYVIARSEALALMWLMRYVKTGPTISAAFELKTKLHQILS